MALSPLTADVAEDTEDALAVQPSRTYSLDLSGVIDGADAIKQFVTKAIQTARYRFPIYGYDYGCELEDIIGRDISAELLATEIPRVIKEAIIYDDRISDVNGFSISRGTDQLYVSFFVVVDDEAIPMEVTI